MAEMNNPKTALLNLRIIWFALVMGVVTIGGMLVFLHQSHEPVEQKPPGPLTFIACGTMLCAIPAGFLVRQAVYRKGAAGGVVLPAQYFTGNVIAMALCEGAAIQSLILWFTANESWWALIAAAVALAVLVLLLPTGRAMYADDIDADNPYRQQP